MPRTPSEDDSKAAVPAAEIEGFDASRLRKVSTGEKTKLPSKEDIESEKKGE